jgi:hypothetical protein
MAKWWPTMYAEFKQIEDKPPAAIPDICEWRGASIVLSPKAYKALRTTLNNFGEFLPVICERETYYIFNCLTFGQIDEINSKQDIQDGVFMGTKNVRFNSVDIADKAVFKTKLDRCLTIFCSSKLKDAVTSNNLTGIEFKEDLADSI